MSIKVSAVLSLVLAMFSWSALADASLGSIHGHTQPSKQVIVINSETGSVVGVMSDSRGDFKADNLKPGEYQVALQSSPSHPAGAPVFAGRTTTLQLPNTDPSH